MSTENKEKSLPWLEYSEDEKKNVMSFCEDYRRFLSEAKTCREFSAKVIEEAKAAGFRSIDEVIASGKLVPGDKVWACHKDRLLSLWVIGSKPFEEGINLVGAHADSPRLDLKQHPVYEDTNLCYLDTHYYGGIKKYQWVTVPLALHGVVVLKDGTKVNIAIGEKDDEPVFCVTDLLIHLSSQQMDKKLSIGIEGEDLNLLVGSFPVDGDKDAVKRTVLSVFSEKYGIEEEDFISAELEAVPAGACRDMGLDRSMLIGYGHDDRVCSYAAWKAMEALPEVPERTCCVLIVDKEEIGSVGATGMHSRFFENTLAELIALTGERCQLLLRRCLQSSAMLSGDVSAGYDPIYASVFERNNSAYIGKGICFNKYTGSRGKSGCNDASPEFMARLRAILDTDKVVWQTAELGKVDAGGGGTIAYIMGNYGMDVIDAGTAVLSMHAPWEVVSKVDVYETYHCYAAFLKNC